MVGFGPGVVFGLVAMGCVVFGLVVVAVGYVGNLLG